MFFQRVKTYTKLAQNIRNTYTKSAMIDEEDCSHDEWEWGIDAEGTRALQCVNCGKRWTEMED